MSNYKIFLTKGNCSYCNESGIVKRRYSGENLCPECFQKNIEKNIYNTISKYKMLKTEDKIIVALSGGKDSMTLLYNLKIIQDRTYNSKPIIALIIDEGIKDYREKSIKKAQDFCTKYNIDYKIISFKEKIGKTLDEIIDFKKKTPDYKYACNYCAAIRRRLLNDGAKDLNGSVLALGHNLTDFAETYLMNILYNRLNMIVNQYFFKEENDKLNQFYIKKISPLIRIPEKEIEIYANIKNLDYNPSHCPYREKDPIIRKRVLDFIEDCRNYSPELEFNLLNGFLELSKTLYYQREKKEYKLCQICGFPCGNGKLCTYCSYIQEFSQ
ncbi:MAG: TIGR00269 family protein [Candidatus Odinarchaeota archaeon]